MNASTQVTNGAITSLQVPRARLQKPTYSGTLWRKKGLLNGWKPNLYVLNDYLLSIHKADVESTRAIDLRGCALFSNLPITGNCFEIHSPAGKVYLFKAPTPESKNQWVIHLEKVCSSTQPPADQTEKGLPFRSSRAEPGSFRASLTDLASHSRSRSLGIFGNFLSSPKKTEANGRSSPSQTRESSPPRVARTRTISSTPVSRHVSEPSPPRVSNEIPPGVALLASRLFTSTQNMSSFDDPKQMGSCISISDVTLENTMRRAPSALGSSFCDLMKAAEASPTPDLESRVQKSTPETVLAEIPDLETFLNPVVVVSILGKIFAANQAAATLLDFESPSKMQGLKISQLIPEPFKLDRDALFRSYFHSSESSLIGHLIEVVATKRGGENLEASIMMAKLPVEGFLLVNFLNTPLA